MIDRLGELAGGAVAEQTPIKRGVHRVRLVDGRSLVAKRLCAPNARTSELAATRWLPAVGLARACPRLLAVAAEPAGRHVWHAYEDLGPHALADCELDAGRVRAAVELVAELHLRFAGHFLLPEVRDAGRELGFAAFAANLADAVGLLERVQLWHLGEDPAAIASCERLRHRLRTLERELPARVAALDRLGLPRTLLHGDLWPTNAFVVPGGRAKLVDWDRAGLGPVAYDLSTVLRRLPGWAADVALEHYRRVMARGGHDIPAAAALAPVLESCEEARAVSRAVWPAMAVLERASPEHVAWGIAELAQVDDWLAAPGAVVA